MSIDKWKWQERKEDRKKKKDEEAGLGIQGQVQCKPLSLVNVESGEHVNKQTTAVTHSYGEMHIHTEGEGGRKWREDEKMTEGWEERTKDK